MCKYGFYYQNFLFVKCFLELFQCFLNQCHVDNMCTSQFFFYYCFTVIVVTDVIFMLLLFRYPFLAWKARTPQNVLQEMRFSIKQVFTLTSSSARVLADGRQVWLVWGEWEGSEGVEEEGGGNCGLGRGGVVGGGRGEGGG